MPHPVSVPLRPSPPGSRPPMSGGSSLTLSLRSELMAVRQTLRAVRRSLDAMPLTEGGAGMVELALAEAMNNVVIHAHGKATGILQLRLRQTGSHLLVRLRDNGRGMPGGSPPDGLPPLTGELGEPPRDGGFGWFLIRSVTSRVRYRRAGGWNCLSFSVPLILRGPAEGPSPRPRHERPGFRLGVVPTREEAGSPLPRSWVIG
ncbi:anti-sigma regulatory factor (Ser/Thr protein kinase) [Brevirhabdus pacifica]|nr:ATP-binding protein [Brevirhabdus pacifica]PJJ85586.1 anti-sigma regulatory factor (Ser/Thr protein kinase) [Brevirhabdus pacifica]